MTNHYNVLIATPGRNVEMSYLKSLLNTIEVLQREEITYKFISQYSSQVTSAREGTIMNDNFLDIGNQKPMLGKATYDKIIWIDSDISWEPADFMKLYMAEEDIVSGVYSSDRGVLMYTPSDYVHLTKTEKIEITHAGFGFIAMKQGVFESLPRPWFEIVFFEAEANGSKHLVPYGEDYSWCEKARKHGYKIYLDPTIIVTHNKVVPLKPQISRMPL